VGRVAWSLNTKRQKPFAQKVCWFLLGVKLEGQPRTFLDLKKEDVKIGLFTLLVLDDENQKRGYR
jgi:hypothetical protein